MRFVPLALVLFALPARGADPDPWLGADKALHFSATFALSAGGYAAAALVTDDRAWRLASGAALGMGAGIAKELRDLAGTGNASWRDLAWDGIGTATGLLTAHLFELAWEHLTGTPPPPPIAPDRTGSGPQGTTASSQPRSGPR